MSVICSPYPDSTGDHCARVFLPDKTVSKRSAVEWWRDSALRASTNIGTLVQGEIQSSCWYTPDSVLYVSSHKSP